MTTAREQTLEHIAEVTRHILTFVRSLSRRAVNHDASKLIDPESPILEKYTPLLEELEYGSPAYFEMLKKLGPFLEHHYANNRHHPEHFPAGGIDDMNLIDIVEMFCDWLASASRGKGGDIHKSIEFNAKRFNMSPQLKNILSNTAHAFKTNSL